MKDNNLNLQELIKNEIIKNLNIKITSEDGGYVTVDLLYNDEVINSDWCKVNMDYNPLDE